jgi:branched-chain amino acid transport system ATP-binding protein
MTLSCRGLRVAYGSVVALRDIDVEVADGKLTTVIGPNGAGKSTLLRTVSGLVHPAAGEILLDGTDVSRDAPERILARGVALVPEGRHVFPHLSVADNLRLGAFARRRDRGAVEERMDDAYERFPVLGRYAARAAGTLSGGEQQMLAIARAMMSRPRVLCLDEPSLGLAPKLVRGVLDMLRALCDEGTTVLLVEQFAYLALQAADTAYLLSNGAILRSGTGAELLADGEVRTSYLGIRERRAG